MRTGRMNSTGPSSSCWRTASRARSRRWSSGRGRGPRVRLGRRTPRDRSPMPAQAAHVPGERDRYSGRQTTPTEPGSKAQDDAATSPRSTWLDPVDRTGFVLSPRSRRPGLADGAPSSVAATSVSACSTAAMRWSTAHYFSGVTSCANASSSSANVFSWASWPQANAQSTAGARWSAALQQHAEIE